MLIVEGLYPDREALDPRFAQSTSRPTVQRAWVAFGGDLQRLLDDVKRSTDSVEYPLQRIDAPKRGGATPKEHGRQTAVLQIRRARFQLAEHGIGVGLMWDRA